MKRRLTLVFASIILAVLYLKASTDSIAGLSSGESVGLVLSGGGAKGIAHIGVIQALEDNDIPIDYITGTSMGAIVGGLYSAGYTPEEMLQLILSKGFSYWSTGRINPSWVYYFNKEEKTPALIHIPVAPKDSTATSFLPTSLISPLPMNFAFMDLFAAYTAQCGENFDNLFVPFRCVCSDMTLKEKHVWRGGDLGDAIRTSMSFPIVFYPLTIDGHVMYDGGIFDNFPVDVMRSDFDPEILIGVDVSTSSKTTNGLVDQLENLIMRHSNYSIPAEEGIKLHIDLNEFGLLDFPKANAIYKIGYDHAMSMMDSIKTRVKGRREKSVVELRRAMFKSATPYVVFDKEKVKVSGGKPNQNDFIKYLFTSNLKQHADTFGIDHARESYYRAISLGRLENLIPHAVPDDSTGVFELDMKASVKDDFKVGIGGYVTSSTNSYLFLNVGYSTLSFRSISANLNAWIGQSYMAGDLNASMRLATGLPSSLGVQIVASRQKYYESDYLFYEDKVPTFIIDSEVFGRLTYSIAAGRHAKSSIGIGGAYLYDRFYKGNTVIDYNLGRDKAYYGLGQVRAAYDYNTLDNEMAPIKGRRYQVTAMGVLGTSEFKPVDEDRIKSRRHTEWVQLEAKTQNYFSGSHWGLGLESDVLLSTRKLIHSYNAAIVQAADYVPSPSGFNYFNPAFRANSFVGLSAIPFWKMNDMFTVRLNLSGFLPLRKIKEDALGNPYYGRWFSDPSFFGEFSASYSFPFATLRGYVNYASFPARNWNCGLSLGLFFLAPRFLR